MNLKNLKSLDLSNYKLSDIPEQLFSFKSLKQLRLIKNNIKQLSPKIENLKNLEEFTFGNCNLQSLHLIR